MTLNEFKAWFEGFSETMEGAPNEKQWARIKARVGEINGTAVSYPVYIDRYVAPYRRWYDGPTWMSNQAVSMSEGSLTVGSTSVPMPIVDMRSVGAAEYKSICS